MLCNSWNPLFCFGSFSFVAPITASHYTNHWKDLNWSYIFLQAKPAIIWCFFVCRHFQKSKKLMLRLAFTILLCCVGLKSAENGWHQSTPVALATDGYFSTLYLAITFILEIKKWWKCFCLVQPHVWIKHLLMLLKLLHGFPLQLERIWPHVSQLEDVQIVSILNLGLMDCLSWIWLGMLQKWKKKHIK